MGDQSCQPEEYQQRLVVGRRGRVDFGIRVGTRRLANGLEQFAERSWRHGGRPVLLLRVRINSTERRYQETYLELPQEEEL